jgi:pyruvate dehydrogenase E2 component (dihydrolipoamide acetyltransferase)
VPLTSADPSGPGAGLSRPLATPRTRAIARRLGVDLTQVQGSGKNGRITDADVERAAGQGAAPDRSAQPAASDQPVRRATPTPAREPVGPGVAAAASGETERVPISHLRKVIADAMHRSKQTAAHVTHVEEADVTELMQRYRQMKPEIQERWGVRFTVLPLFIKALVAVLRRYPIFNATVDEEAGELLLKRFYNIGVAVDTPEGLIVPVIKGADRKSMVELADEVADLAGRARERRLALDELRGGTCTITNIGPLGGVFATPIINQPELAIIGLHKIQERPVVVDGEIVVRSMMYLSISFDHRYIDGADAARFMTELAGLVSNPDLLMAQL